MDSDTFTTAPL